MSASGDELSDIITGVFKTRVRFEARFISTDIQAPYLCYSSPTKFVILMNDNSIKKLISIINCVDASVVRAISLLFWHDMQGTISIAYRNRSDYQHVVDDLCTLAEHCNADELCISDHRVIAPVYANRIRDSHERNNKCELCFMYPTMSNAFADTIRDTNLRNREVKPHAITLNTINIAIALSHLYTIGFGPYVLLEIINWTNPRYHNTHDNVKLKVLQNIYMHVGKKYALF